MQSIEALTTSSANLTVTTNAISFEIGPTIIIWIHAPTQVQITATFIMRNQNVSAVRVPMEQPLVITKGHVMLQPTTIV